MTNLKIIKLYKSLPLAAKISFRFVFCSFFQKGIAVLSSPIINRILTQEEYGLYSVYGGRNGIFSILATLNLASGYVSVSLSNTDNLQERNKIISSIQGLSTIISSIFLFIFLILHSQIESLTSLPFIVLLFMFISYIFMNSFSLIITKDKFNGKYIRMLICTCVFSVISPLLTIISLKINSQYRDVIRIIVPICIALSYDVVFFVLNIIKGKCFFDKEIWKSALFFNLPLIPHYISSIVLTSSDRIIINSLVGLTEAGIYGFAYTISSLLLILIEPLYTSIQPRFFKKIEIKDFKSIKNVTSIITLVLTIIIILVILLGPELVFLFGGDKYKDANSFLPILFSGTFVSAFYIQFLQVEFKNKKTILIMISSLMAAAINIGLNYWLIPIFGYKAAAYTTLISYLFYGVFHFISQMLITHATLFNRPLYLILLSIVIGVAFISRFIYEFSLLRYILIALFFIITICILIVLIINRKKIIKRIKDKEDTK